MSTPKAMRYFSYDPENGESFHETEAEAKAEAQRAIEQYADCCYPEWPEEVERVCYGAVLGRATEVVQRAPGTYDAEDNGASDYVLTPPSPPIASERCPRCDSPQPHLHPAMAFEGEVQPCPHPFHQTVTEQNTPEKIASLNPTPAAPSPPIASEFEPVVERTGSLGRIIALYEDALSLIANHPRPAKPSAAAEWCIEKANEALAKKGAALRGEIYAQITHDSPGRDDSPAAPGELPTIPRATPLFDAIVAEKIRRGQSLALILQQWPDFEVAIRKELSPPPRQVDDMSVREACRVECKCAAVHNDATWHEKSCPNGSEYKLGATMTRESFTDWAAHWVPNNPPGQTNRFRDAFALELSRWVPRQVDEGKITGIVQECHARTITIGEATDRILAALKGDV